MSTNSLSNIPSKAIVRLVALLDDVQDDNETNNSSNNNSNSVTMNCAQAASLSKLVADQAAATEWESIASGGEQGEGGDHSSSQEQQQQLQEVTIPVPIGTTDNLKAIVRYLSARLASPQREIPAPLVAPIEEVIDDCDKEFLKFLGDSLRKDIIPLSSIAHYLNIPSLRDLMCATMASFMSHMTVEQMQVMLGVESDFSDQEVNILKKELGLMEDFHWKALPSATEKSA